MKPDSSECAMICVLLPGTGTAGGLGAEAHQVAGAVVKAVSIAVGVLAAAPEKALPGRAGVTAHARGAILAHFILALGCDHTRAAGGAVGPHLPALPLGAGGDGLQVGVHPLF